LAHNAALISTLPQKTATQIRFSCAIERYNGNSIDSGKNKDSVATLHCRRRDNPLFASLVVIYEIKHMKYFIQHYLTLVNMFRENFVFIFQANYHFTIVKNGYTTTLLVGSIVHCKKNL
jgi:hypothetical protein